MTDSADRVKAYLAARERAEGLDPERIHRFDNFDLTVSDLRSLLDHWDAVVARTEAWEEGRRHGAETVRATVRAELADDAGYAGFFEATSVIDRVASIARPVAYEVSDLRADED